MACKINHREYGVDGSAEAWNDIIASMILVPT